MKTRTRVSRRSILNATMRFNTRSKLRSSCKYRNGARREMPSLDALERHLKEVDGVFRAACRRRSTIERVERVADAIERVAVNAITDGLRLRLSLTTRPSFPSFSFPTSSSSSSFVSSSGGSPGWFSFVYFCSSYFAKHGVVYDRYF